MGHGLNLLGLLISLAGISYTTITSYPDDWSAESAKQWVFHASGWITAILFTLGSSVHVFLKDRSRNNSISNLQSELENTREKHREVTVKLSETQRENATIIRTIEYLMDRVSPEEPIKRKVEREGDHDV